jgi:hypothetical protein
MKNIIILNRVPLDESPYHEWLDLEQYNIYLISETGNLDRTPEARALYAEVHELDNYLCNANVESWAMEVAGRVEIAAIVAYSEADIIRAARCRKLLGLPGQDMDSALSFRDKLKMRVLSEENGLACPGYLGIEDAHGLRNFVAEVGYPIVVKPRLGMASKRVMVIKDEQGLDAFLENTLYADTDVIYPYIAESFIEGRLYSVDLLVIDGKIGFAEPLRYVADGLAYASRAARAFGNTQITRDDPDFERLIRFCEQLLTCFPHPGYGGFHIEAFVNDAGTVTLCEAASRNGGGGIPQIIEYAYGLNPDCVGVRLQASLGEDRAWVDEMSGESKGTWGVWIMSRGERRAGWRVPQEAPFPFVADYQVAPEPAAESDVGVENIAQFAAMAILKAGSMAELAENRKTLESWFYSPET